MLIHQIYISEYKNSESSYLRKGNNVLFHLNSFHVILFLLSWTLKLFLKSIVIFKFLFLHFSSITGVVPKAPVL